MSYGIELADNTIPEHEWQVCRHLDELWELAHSPQAVFYTPEETHALMQGRIDAAKARQKLYNSP